MFIKVIKSILMPKGKSTGPAFYAVHTGKTRGIYYTWADCEKEIKNVNHAKFKKFTTLAEAEEFVRDGPKPYRSAYANNSTAVAAGGAGAGGRTYGRGSSTGSATTTGGKPAAGSTASTARIAANAANAKRETLQKDMKAIARAADTVVIWTDGSSLGNGKNGSQAGVGVYFGPGDPRNVSERLQSEPQTNQRAELMAALRALEVCGDDNKPVEIRSDSMYTINIVNQWAAGWVKNNWKRSDGQPVMNRDIIEPLLAKIKNRSGLVTWTHVKAHVGTHGNEMADKLANAGALMPRSAQ